MRSTEALDLKMFLFIILDYRFSPSAFKVDVNKKVKI